ncbi:type II toxin-antitoxin system toxin ribonuclease C26 [Streptomyces capparidis]
MDGRAQVTQPHLLDTGVLFALMDSSDAHHVRCAAHLSSLRGPLLVPAPVVAETAALLERRLGPKREAAFLEYFSTGRLSTVDLSRQDYARVAELVVKYADFPLGMVDASVVTVAERLNLKAVHTVDRRHFSAVRPRHIDVLAVLP